MAVAIVVGLLVVVAEGLIGLGDLLELLGGGLFIIDVFVGVPLDG